MQLVKLTTDEDQIILRRVINYIGISHAQGCCSMNLVYGVHSQIKWLPDGKWEYKRGKWQDLFSASDLATIKRMSSLEMPTLAIPLSDNHAGISMLQEHGFIPVFEYMGHHSKKLILFVKPPVDGTSPYESGKQEFSKLFTLFPHGTIINEEKGSENG